MTTPIKRVLACIKVLANYTAPSLKFDIVKHGDLTILRLSNLHNEPFTDIRIDGEQHEYLEILEPMRSKEYTLAGKNVTLSYKTPYGQEFSRNIEFLLSTEDPETAQAQYMPPTKSELFALPSSHIPPAAIIMAVASVLLITIFLLVKSRTGKSSLEREIERIRKMAEQEEKGKLI